MKEKSFADNIMAVLNTNRKDLVGTLGDSPTRDLEMLLKITFYLRQHVIPLHEIVAGVIKTAHKALLSIETHLLQSIQTTQMQANEIHATSQCLARKMNEINEKQKELVTRAMKVRDSLYTKIEKCDVHEQFVEDLDCYKNEVNYLNIKLNNIRDRFKNMKYVSKQNKMYMHDWQLKIVHDNFSIMNKTINELMNEIQNIKKELYHIALKNIT